jgi:hypothetical protein
MEVLTKKRNVEGIELMKQVQRFALIAVIIMTMIIAGCSAKTPPKEALLAASMKTMEATSYKMSTTLQLDELELPESPELEAGMSTASIAGMIKDATIKADAIYTKDPMRLDMNMEVILPGMMDMKLEIPMIITDKVVYVKIPNIPMLGIPETIVDKYVQIDIEELAAEQGAELNMDVAAQQKLVQELSAALLKHFDEKTYFSELKAKDAGLPEGVSADQVVKFAISEENYAQTVETLVNKALPELLDIMLSNDSFLEYAQLEKADLEQAKADLETNKTEILNVLQNNLKFNVLELTGAIKGDNLVYQAAKVSMQVKDEASGLDTKIGLSVTTEYSELNEKVTFEQEIPTDALTTDELTELFGGMYEM